jgi:hypothetical protein
MAASLSSTQLALYDELCELIEHAGLQRLRLLKAALEPARRRFSHYSGFSDEQADRLLSLVSRRVRLLAREEGARLRRLRAETPHTQPARPKKKFEVDPGRFSEQLQLFGGDDRLPRRPYCSDDLEQGVRIRGLAQALTKPYIQVNPPHLRVWSIFDVDRPGAGLAWEDAGLPPPAWTAVNRENGHAHIVYGLSAPVLVDSPDMRQAPLRYLCAVEAAFREKLGADNGYSGLITKNPAHPLWRLLRGPRLGYELGELAEWVDLPKHAPKRKPEEVGLGRNVTLFDWLRQYAYRQIRHYKGDVRNFVVWQSHLNSRALERNGDFMQPLTGNEVWHIAKSVSKWTWRRFDLAASDARFSALQAHRGRQGGVASGLSRAAASEDKRTSARLMQTQGMTQQAIADALGVPRRTVSYWLSRG